MFSLLSPLLEAISQREALAKNTSLHTVKARRRHSKNGCARCRRLKRKCDESQPLCLSCVLTQTSCVYHAVQKPLVQTLDDEGILLLDYFKEEVVRAVTMVPEHLQNHFETTFMRAAQHSRAILELLTAWGALFLCGANSDTFSRRLDNASHAYKPPTAHSADQFHELCYRTSLVGLRVCSGSTEEWYEDFQKCIATVRQFGGVASFLSKFSNLHEAKMLMSNVHYEDVTASVSLQHGTALPMEEYSVLFADDLDYTYGVDPLQGVIHPVFLLLGEIANSILQLRQKRSTLDRMRYYVEATACSRMYMEQIEQCQPKPNQQCFLNESDLDLHLSLFEAFRNTCKLNVLLYIVEMRPTLPEVQLLLLDTFKLLDVLIECPLRPTVASIMLMCGLVAVLEEDRVELLAKFDRLMANYKAANVEHVRDLVLKSWREQLHTVEWFLLCEEMGWKLSTS